MSQRSMSFLSSDDESAIHEFLIDDILYVRCIRTTTFVPFCHKLSPNTRVTRGINELSSTLLARCLLRYQGTELSEAVQPIAIGRKA